MNPASTPSDEWLALPPEERDADLPGQAGVAALPDRARRAGHQFPVRDPRLCRHLRSAMASRARPPVVGAVAAGIARPSARASSRATAIVAIDGQRDRPLRGHRRLCRAFARASACASRSSAAARPLDGRGDRRDRGRSATSSATSARIGLLGVAPAGRIIVPLAPHRSCPARRSRRPATPCEMMVVDARPGRHRRSARSRNWAGRSRSPISGQQASLGWLAFFWFMTHHLD